MSSTTPAPKTGTPRWVTVGTATLQHSALRLEVLVGPGRGTYYIPADDVPRLTEESVQVYKLRTVRGEIVPTVAGFTYSSQTGAMVIVQLDEPMARVMLPAVALLSHLAHPAENKPTRIAAPREEVYPDLSPLQAVPA
jgi:hypothetical protein